MAEKTTIVRIPSNRAARKDRITMVCKDGGHDLCSTRVCINPEKGWHFAHYQPCQCKCHSPEGQS